MATLEQIKTWVKTRIRADMETPEISDLHDNSIETWANEKTVDVIKLLDESHYPQLIVPDESLAFSNGEASLPTNFQKEIAVVAGNSDKRCRITHDVDDFKRFDGSNFLLTPNVNYPFVLIADKIRIIPTSFSSGKLTYIKSHPTIDDSNGTKFDDLGDEILTLLIIREYYLNVVQRDDLAANIFNEIGVLVNGTDSSKS